MIGVFIDAGVWNFLYERNLDLAQELLRPEFGLMHTREAEFEIPVGKPELESFIRDSIIRSELRTDSFFGFFQESYPIEEQRLGGFDVGRFASQEEIEFLSKYRASDKVRPTKLHKNEADISLASRSFHSVVLTTDLKSVALRDAKQNGGKVVWLNDFDLKGQSLADLVREANEQSTH